MNLFLAVFMILLSSSGGCPEDTPPSKAWVGKYAMTQTCDGITNPDYILEIRSVANAPNQRTLLNLGGYGQRVAATVQGDSLTIIPTEVNVGLMGQVQLSGTGGRQTGGRQTGGRQTGGRQTGGRRTGVRRNEELFIQLTVRGPGPQGTTTTSRCALRGTPLGA